MFNVHLIAPIAALVVGLSACTAPPASVSQLPAQTNPASEPAASNSLPADAIPDRGKRPIPVGTVLRVRLYHAIDTNRSQPGDSFVASLSAPITVDEKTVLPKGTVVRGVIKHSTASGRLKGRATVALTLDRMEWNGAELPINTNSVTWTSGDHKKRNLAWIGGGSAAGTLMGALLGGGKGALIGAAAGGGAGVAGAAATGKSQVRIPAESILTFRLEQPVAI